MQGTPSTSLSQVLSRIKDQKFLHGDDLKHLRTEFHFTMSALQDKTGVHRNTIGRLEECKTADQVKKLTDFVRNAGGTLASFFAEFDDNEEV
jgi:transcriptional regulator with XRE-family HTH domain